MVSRGKKYLIIDKGKIIMLLKTPQTQTHHPQNPVSS
jgi:hypothetical protein